MKLVDNEPNIHAIRKLSSLFAEANEEIDLLLSVVINTATEMVSAKHSSLLMLDVRTTEIGFD